MNGDFIAGGIVATLIILIVGSGACDSYELKQERKRCGYVCARKYDKEMLMSTRVEDGKCGCVINEAP